LFSIDKNDKMLVGWHAPGTLEWQEKQKPNDPGQRMTRSLPCHIVIGPDEHDM